MQFKNFSLSGNLIKFFAILGFLFIHIPLLVILMYAFTTDEKTFQFPLPGYTLKWFAVTWEREDVWTAMYLSLKVSFFSTLMALVFGTLGALAIYRTNFFGKETISFLVILPIALPGIITGIALRSAMNIMEIPFSTWTIVVAHATFCIVTVYNNVIARLRRTSYNLIEASLDLGANSFQTFLYIVLPNIGSALLAGAMLSFALSFDEVIVTTFTSGQQQTIPIWMLTEFTRPRQRPVTNVVAILVIAITTIPIILAYYLTSNNDSTGGSSK
jgi:putative spermidine/putrescine transport system permease protein